LARAKASVNVSSVAKAWEEGSEPDIRERRGRPPITGEYCKLAAAKKAVNDERGRELRLDMEARTFNMEETLKILQMSKLYPEDMAKRGKLTSTVDLASRIREAQAEIVRISRVSSNLQGPMQRTLRVAASLKMGLTDVLRIRTDAANEQMGHNENAEELRRLVANLQKEQEKACADIN